MSSPSTSPSSRFSSAPVSARLELEPQVSAQPCLDAGAAAQLHDAARPLERLRQPPASASRRPGRDRSDRSTPARWSARGRSSPKSRGTSTNRAAIAPSSCNRRRISWCGPRTSLSTALITQLSDVAAPIRSAKSSTRSTRTASTENRAGLSYSMISAGVTSLVRRWPRARRIVTSPGPSPATA